MGQYPDTNEILNEMEAEAGSDVAGGGQVPPDGGAGAHGEASPPTPNYLDFDQYKGHLVKFKASGKEIEAPYEKFHQYAQQGYDYAQKMEALKRDYIPRSDLDQRYVPKDQYDALNRFKQYDDYAKQNPQWAEYVERQWAQRDLVGNPNYDPDDPNAQLLSKLQQSLEERLSQFDQRFQSIEQHYSGQKASAEDKALDESISETREKFSFIDFNRVDESGKSVEMNVLEHMEQTGIKNFKTAFVDLYQDEILQRAETNALEKSAKERQKQAKQGIVGVSATPTAKTQGFNGRPRSDQEASALALQFLEQNS